MKKQYYLTNSNGLHKNLIKVGCLVNQAILIQNITKRFGNKTVLDHVDLEIQEGEIFGLLGPSGAGKTTLINILTGQLKRTEGEAYVFGKDTSNLPDDIYLSIGMVLEKIGIFERLSCYQNLAVFANIHKIQKSRIDEVLKMVHLDEDSKTEAFKLSKGMRQRLAIARAILHKPKLLFLDEPTSGLDPANALEIHKLIFSLREQGVTVFLTTHKMDEAMKLCDHVAMLYHGKMIEYGIPSEICLKYNEVNTIEITLNDGSVIHVANNAESADMIASYFRNEQVRTIHSSEPDLETVFLAVTNSEGGNQ